MSVKPYAAEGSKRDQVERMFNAISPRYDLLNRLFSAGIDQAWRRRVMREVMTEPVQRLLDVATGTADLALLAARQVPQVTGADISAGMLAHGRAKVARAGLSDRVHLVQADAADLPFPSATFDAVTVAFGVRNFEDLQAGVRGMLNVLRPGGRLFVLEFSKPRGVFGPLFRFYFHHVMPVVGRLVSRDGSAYSYLPSSVDAFPSVDAFAQLLRAAGAREVRAIPLTGHIATLHIATA